MIDFKPIVDAIIVQLTPQIADAVIARLKAEGTGLLALEPGALEIPFDALLDTDSHAMDKLKALMREEARDILADVNEDEVAGVAHRAARDYMRENIDERVDSAIQDHMREADYVEAHNVEDNIDLSNFDDFTDLRDKVEELDQQINKLVNGEKPDAPSPFYNSDEYLKPEFVQAVRDALSRIAAGNSII
jgi:hypothetical protein